MTPAYRLTDVTIRSLTNVTADIPAGRVTCIVGASGAGKSTLLQLLAGVLQPQSGEVERRVSVRGTVHHGQCWNACPTGGERLAAVRAMLARSPEALLLDEPTKRIDEPSAVLLGRELRGASTTVVVVTHDHRLARSMGGRALVVADGSLRYEPAATIDYLRIQDATMEALRRVTAPLDSGYSAGTRPPAVR